MARKHVYLQLIEIGDIRVLRNDPKIERPPDYNDEEQKNIVAHELGSLNTFEATYHIIKWQPTISFCYWCGHEMKMRTYRTSMKMFPNLCRMCMECPICFSRGPVLTVRDIDYEKTELLCEDFVKQRYRQINPYGDFENPYRENENEQDRSDTKTT